jgi:hypothetical protein
MDPGVKKALRFLKSPTHDELTVVLSSCAWREPGNLLPALQGLLQVMNLFLVIPGRHRCRGGRHNGEQARQWRGAALHWAIPHRQRPACARLGGFWAFSPFCLRSS